MSAQRCASLEPFRPSESQSGARRSRRLPVEHRYDRRVHRTPSLGGNDRTIVTREGRRGCRFAKKWYKEGKDDENLHKA
jgi:hypothetical protein